jgi:hypothetical protein
MAFWKHVDKQTIKQKYQEGWPITLIAKQLGVHRNTVYYHLKQMGVPIRERVAAF